MPAAEVRCAGVTYFADEEGLRPDGTVGTIRVRREAARGDIIDLSQSEYDRLEALDAVQKPGSAPTAPTAAVSTLFTVGAPSEFANAPADTSGVPAEPLAGGYADENKDALQAEADRRGLTVNGTGKDGAIVKDDLVAALEADDASRTP